jgi:hypothetical protein
VENLDLNVESQNRDLGEVNLSKTGSDVSFGDVNVFRRGVQVKKTAFEGSIDGK